MEPENKKLKLKPFVKWAGGKRQILYKIRTFIDSSLSAMNCESFEDNNITYIEPFVGGGAVFFDLQPKKAIINDLNEDLINVYEVIRSDDYKKLIKLLKDHKEKYSDDEHNVDYYQEIREWDREPNWKEKHGEIERAARMIFLNKTCYNGLYRVNLKGEFNTPIGRYKNPLICDEETIENVHNYLKTNKKIEIMCGSYINAIRKANADDIIYLDPPYDYEDNDGFTKYQMQGFTFEDFKLLKEECDKALNRGAYIIISNNATEKVKQLFAGDSKYRLCYEQDVFSAMRNINCKGDSRKNAQEIIIWGLPNGIPLPQANDVEKIIALLMTKEENLSKTDELINILNVEAKRQVSYYKSAASFLNYINNKHQFTSRANEIRQLPISLYKSEVAKDIINHEKLKNVFQEYVKNKDILNEEIVGLLRKDYSGLSPATLKRRASTIKKWLEWADKNK